MDRLIAAPAAFADPATYDFALVHLTDTQYLSQGAVAAATPQARERFAEAYRAQVRWVTQNAQARKIAYVAHTGDIVESWVHLDGPADQARAEFAFASQVQAELDASGVPNGVLPGNHDNQSGLAAPELFNAYFGPRRYVDASRGWSGAAYGGPWRAGDNAHHYDLVSAPGAELVLVHLGFGTPAEAVDWADEVLDRHADRTAVILTHAYLEASWRPDGRLEEYSVEPAAALVRERLVAGHDNVALVLCGHNHGVAWSVDGGALELLSDYQSYEVEGERSCGFLRLLQVSVARREVRVTTYSPRLDAFGATAYDPAPRDYEEIVDNFVAPISVVDATLSVR